MNTSADAPLYAAICRSLLNRIHSGDSGYTDKLPSERELMEEFNTTRVTLRIALSQLESEGSIYRSNRRGWFVTPPKLRFDPTLRSNFSAIAMRQGRRPATELLHAGQQKVKSQQDGAALRLQRGDEVFRVQRRRSIDGRYVLLEHIELNAQLLPDLGQHDLSSSLTSIFHDYYGIEVKREEISIDATALSREQAAVLNVADGSFCLAIERWRYSQHGEVIEYDREWWLHNAIQIQVQSEAGVTALSQ